MVKNNNEFKELKIRGYEQNEEYLECFTKLCEKYIANDEEFKAMNEEIILDEQALKSTLTHEQQKLYRALESKMIKLHTHEKLLTCKYLLYQFFLVKQEVDI